jgi:predicted double-glycine peptidase
VNTPPSLLLAVLTVAAGPVACQMPPPAPIEGQSFQLGHHGLSVERRVVSFGEQRWKSVVRQQLDYSCGAAALATLLQYHYQDPVPEAEIIESMIALGDADRIRREGFSLLDLQNFAQQRGYQTRGFRIGPEVLDRLVIPSITLVTTRGYGHFVVLKGALDDDVYLADPALGHRVMRKDAFVEEWAGVVFFVAAERDDPSLSPLEQLASNRLAPRSLVRRLDFLGLRNVVVSSPTEF